MSETTTKASSLNLEEIASLITLNHAKHLNIGEHQVQHRIDLVEFWEIQSGEKVLELGCGQGDCTAVIACAVGVGGRVVAIDPASLDYGSPATLGEAQSYLKSSSIGERIEFIQSDPRDYLAGLHPPSSKKYTYDVGILSQCSWYFASPTILSETVALLAQHCERICIAEFALSSTNPNALPHVLAALTQASLECRKPESESNIRTVLSPEGLRKIALQRDTKLKLLKERVIVPRRELEDGRWEVAAVKVPGFDGDIERYVENERERAVVNALKDAMLANLQVVKAKGEKVATMDVWVATFVHDD